MGTQPHSPGLPLQVSGRSLAPAWEASGQRPSSSWPLHGWSVVGPPHSQSLGSSWLVLCMCSMAQGRWLRRGHGQRRLRDTAGPLVASPASVIDTLVSWGCHYKSPQAGWLRSAEMYSLTFWRPEVCVGRAVLPPKPLGEDTSSSVRQSRLRAAALCPTSRARACVCVSLFLSSQDPHWI